MSEAGLIWPFCSTSAARKRIQVRIAAADKAQTGCQLAVSVCRLLFVVPMIGVPVPCCYKISKTSDGETSRLRLSAAITMLPPPLPAAGTACCPVLWLTRRLVRQSPNSVGCAVCLLLVNGPAQAQVTQLSDKAKRSIITAAHKHIAGILK